jgi:hypothetical protein
MCPIQFQSLLMLLELPNGILKKEEEEEAFPYFILL